MSEYHEGSEMPRYYVVTPEYGRVDVIGRDRGPVEYGRDVIEVEAPTRRAAVVEGVKRMLAGNPREFKWCRDAQSAGANPFKGVRVVPFAGDERAGGPAGTGGRGA